MELRKEKFNTCYPISLFTYMKENLALWSYNDFLAFLLIYAASADFTITEEERIRMAQQIGYDSYKKALPVFEAQSDFERLQTILYFKPTYFPTGQEVESILQQVQAIYKADNNYSSTEQSLLLLLRKVLS